MEKGSPAHAAGLHAGDIIVQFDGKPVSGVKDVLGRVGTQVGRSISARVISGGSNSAKEITIVTGSAAEVKQGLN